MTLHRYRRELAVAAAYVALLGVLAVTHREFYRGQFFATAVASVPVLVLGIGMTLVLIARHVDISVGSQFSVCGVVAAASAAAGMPVGVAALLAVAAGVGMGAVNGALVAFAALPSIVVTLATLGIIGQALQWARHGQAVNDLPDRFQWFGLSQTAGEWALLAIGGGLLVAFAIVARFVSAGRAVYAVGSDLEAARLAGLRPRWVTFGVFVLMGGLSGVAATLNAVRFASVDAALGRGLEMSAIAAAVVGGTAVAGGRGTLLGTLVGVALLSTIGPALLFLRVDQSWQLAVQGGIILAAVAADGLPARRGRHVA